MPLDDDVVPEYKAKHLAKINSMRMANSQPAVHVVPVLTKGQVLFVTAASRDNQPNSCYNCHMFNKSDSTCMVHSPDIKIRKFTYGEPYKEIEYWPVCGLHDFGKPNNDEPKRISENDPDYTGLAWINAPRVGQKFGGSNCGGSNGGDDCDYFQVEEGEGDKRTVSIGFCRVLQTPVGNGDCCAAWTDDDLLSWQKAQSLIQEVEDGKR